MKIIIVGANQEFSIENFYVKYLREEGHEVIHYPAQSIFNKFYSSGIINKVLFRAKLAGIYAHINKEFRCLVAHHKPRVIWVFKGMELFASTLAWVKKQGCYLVNYNPDNPFLFSGKGSGNSNVTKSVDLYDLHFTYNHAVLKTLKEKTACDTALLPFGFDVSEDIMTECAELEEVMKVCFLGNPDTYRAAFLLEIAKEFQIDVYGVNWDKYISHPNISIFPAVLGAAFWKTLRKYRVQLNLMRPHNLDSHNMRSFEAPGVGGILLAPDTADHRQFFTDGEEIFLFNDALSCTKKISQLLTLTERQAEAIRENAKQRSVSSGYSYKDRARLVSHQLIGKVVGSGVV